MIMGIQDYRIQDYRNTGQKEKTRERIEYEYDTSVKWCQERGVKYRKDVV